jgi:hypothetical protein
MRHVMKNLLVPAAAFATAAVMLSGCYSNVEAPRQPVSAVLTPAQPAVVYAEPAVVPGIVYVQPVR